MTREGMMVMPLAPTAEPWRFAATVQRACVFDRIVAMCPDDPGYRIAELRYRLFPVGVPVSLLQLDRFHLRPGELLPLGIFAPNHWPRHDCFAAPHIDPGESIELLLSARHVRGPLPSIVAFVKVRT